jgi:hypothetical protein
MPLFLVGIRRLVEATGDLAQIQPSGSVLSHHPDHILLGFVLHELKVDGCRIGSGPSAPSNGSSGQAEQSHGLKGAAWSRAPQGTT